MERLPEILPVFPLTGAVLLPRGELPLNIFEPRYVRMTDDAIAGERLIGMISVADRPMRIFRDLGQATRWLDGQKPGRERSPPK